MWEIVGFEIAKNEAGEMTGITLYCSKPLTGDSGEGCKVCGSLQIGWG